MAPTTPTIGGFHILPVSIPPLPSFPQEVTHHIYLRRNEPKVATPDDARSLFLTNLPVDCTDYHLRALFASVVGTGRFESVTFDDDDRAKSSPADALPPRQASQQVITASGKKRKRGEDDAHSLERAQEEAAARLPETWTRKLHRSGGTAVVVLADTKSAEQVLKAVTKLHRGAKSKGSNLPVWGGELVDGRVPPLGTAWLKAHNRLAYPDKAAVQASVDAFFALYNSREREAAELAKRLRNEPDEDGFVTVTRGGRNAPARVAEAEEAKAKMLEKEEKKKKDMMNFYRFQVREKRKAEQEALVKKFEEDRRKVSAMREKRSKFRPE